MTQINKAHNDLFQQMKALALRAQNKPEQAANLESKQKASVQKTNAEKITADKKIDKFGDVLLNQLNNVNNLQVQAGQMAEKIAMGDKNLSLSQAMTQMVKADTSMLFLVKARNRLLDAYKEIMNMNT